MPTPPKDRAYGPMRYDFRVTVNADIRTVKAAIFLFLIPIPGTALDHQIPPAHAHQRTMRRASRRGSHAAPASDAAVIALVSEYMCRRG